MIVLLQEGQDISMFSADEAMIGLPRLAHHHGRMAIIVERANALVIDASLREGDI